MYPYHIPRKPGKEVYRETNEAALMNRFLSKTKGKHGHYVMSDDQFVQGLIKFYGHKKDTELIQRIVDNRENLGLKQLAQISHGMTGDLSLEQTLKSYNNWAEAKSDIQEYLKAKLPPNLQARLDAYESYGRVSSVQLGRNYTFSKKDLPKGNEGRAVVTVWEQDLVYSVEFILQKQKLTPERLERGYTEEDLIFDLIARPKLIKK